MFYINPDYPMQQIVFRDIANTLSNPIAILLLYFRNDMWRFSSISSMEVRPKAVGYPITPSALLSVLPLFPPYVFRYDL